MPTACKAKPQQDDTDAVLTRLQEAVDATLGHCDGCKVLASNMRKAIR